MKNKLIYEPERADTTPYNIFGAIDSLDSTDDKNEALEQLAFLLMPEQLNINANAKFYLDSGRKILTASLQAFYYEGIDFIQICEKRVSSSYVDLFTEIDNTNNEDAKKYISSFAGTPEETISGCKQSCDDAIKLPHKRQI